MLASGTGSWDLSCAQPSSSRSGYVCADITCAEGNAARVLRSVTPGMGGRPKEGTSRHDRKVGRDPGEVICIL